MLDTRYVHIPGEDWQVRTCIKHVRDEQVRILATRCVPLVSGVWQVHTCVQHVQDEQKRMSGVGMTFPLGVCSFIFCLLPVGPHECADGTSETT